MPTDSEHDAALRKQRAEEIRRLRDLRNAGIAGDDSGEPAPDDPGAVPDEEPNYVDRIDRKMREERG